MSTTPASLYGPLLDDDDVAAVTRLVSLAFGSPREGCETWLREAGLEHLRVMRDAPGAPPHGSLLRIPMGQFFGGLRVPLMGVAGVAVAPEARGQGTARAMMAEAVREFARDGFALACLYASTQTLYRQAGFEQAGHAFRVALPLAEIGVRAREPAVRALTAADEPAVRACYAAYAAQFDGMLDRGPYAWRRARQHRGDTFQGFGVAAPEADGARARSEAPLEGYVFFAQRANAARPGHFDLVISDVAFTTARAGRRVLGLLADFGMMGVDALFQAGPMHPLFTLLPQQHFRVEKREYWMLRVLSVPAALTSRGYPAGLSARVRLAVRDEVIPANDGAFTLTVADRRAHVARSDAPAADDPPTLALDVRGLAALYTGLYTPRQALLAGLIEPEGTDPAALDRAAALFSSGTPWMPDSF